MLLCADLTDERTQTCTLACLPACRPPGSFCCVRLLPGPQLDAASGGLRVALAQALLQQPPVEIKWLWSSQHQVRPHWQLVTHQAHEAGIAYDALSHSPADVSADALVSDVSDVRRRMAHADGSCTVTALVVASYML